MDSDNIIIINGNEFPFKQGETIFEIARQNNIDIPSLCYLKGTSPSEKCQMCIVEIDGESNPVTSCNTAAKADMVVRTSTSKIIAQRKSQLEEFLSSGNHNCLVQDLDIDSWTDFQLKAMAPKEHENLCPAYGECQLQDLAIKYNVRLNKPVSTENTHAIENANPFIARDLSRCILCGKCVQSCNEIQVNNVIHIDDSRPDPKVITENDQTLKDSNCVFCGECMQVCPVGALVEKDSLNTDGGLDHNIKKVRTTCSYCGVGCQIYLHVKNNEIVKVSGVDVKPNYGSLCVKGRFGYNFVNSPERLTKPLVRKNGKLKETSWDEAIKYTAEKLTKIKKESGPDTIGVLSSARITNEENYLAQKFARAVIGTNNVDHCARL